MFHTAVQQRFKEMA